jgi:hypothetical protein
MAERSAEPPAICLEFAFDRLLPMKLQQVYGLLVADCARPMRQASKENGGGAHEAGSDLRKGLLGQTEGGAHNCESNGGAACLRLAARLQRSR